MTVAISQAHNEARLTGTRDFMDLGAAHARIRIYNGTRPAAGGAATTLLVEIELNKPSGSVASGVLTLSSTDDPLVTNSGTATWARIVNGNGDWVLDCDVTATGGGGEVTLPSTTLFAGGRTTLVVGLLG